MSASNERRFVLVEHSLRRLGGHYFLYALQVLTAAEQAGYEPVLAVNREFRSIDRFPSHWTVRPLFENRALRLHRVVLSGDGGLANGFARRVAHAVDTAWALLKSFRVRAQRKSSVAEFRAACERLFGEIALREGDLVYFSTIGDLDLLALCAFLETRPELRCADWHLQFHLPVYAGRDPEFDAQERKVEGLRARFADVRRRLPGFRLTVHTTNDPLTRQYHRVGEVTAKTLPWPTGVPKYADFARPAGDPLRLVLPGALRREKGSKEFASVFRAVQRSDLGGKRVQFLVQCSEKRREEDLKGLPLAAASEAAVNGVEPMPTTAIAALPHPLGDEAYERLIQTADVGVMIYGAEDYFARASGILVEFLAAGVPVVVPAGSWLSDAIQDPTDAWLADLAANATVSARAEGGEQVELATSDASRDLLVRLAVHESQGHGVYARVSTVEFDAEGKELARAESVVAARPPQGDVVPSARFTLAKGAVRVRVRVDSAFRSGVLAAPRLEVRLLAASANGPRPLGLLGLAVSDRDSVPRAIADLVRHHAHYRKGAQAFALQWRHAHAPERSIEILTGERDVRAR